ncbi:hypothetical protein RC1_2203 [Rhodospirillum centenum SW]|uniref:Uncharacterized protein n=1 Tax=Rhodospirillum centenum (strain ATCC 51521 / SW) TaxID=414684 RepID=B6IP88_RHOCS|nr:hypothetical protein RC1_2203 [Rhodospirillum centenum SW]
MPSGAAASGLARIRKCQTEKRQCAKLADWRRAVARGVIPWTVTVV